MGRILREVFPRHYTADPRGAAAIIPTGMIAINGGNNGTGKNTWIKLWTTALSSLPSPPPVFPRNGGGARGDFPPMSLPLPFPSSCVLEGKISANHSDIAGIW